MRTLALLSLTLLLASCGKSNSNAGLPIVKTNPQLVPMTGPNVEGLYMAKFKTLNGHVVGDVPGSATIQRQGDQFFAFVQLAGGAPNGWHQQDIHEGTRCPTAADDLNGDGFIDVAEGENVYGKILIPLDSNINTQNAGRSIYPLADDGGTYFYERSGSVRKMLNDLSTDDKNLNDNYVKIPPQMGLILEGKVVVVHGTSETVSFPETVATTEGKPQFQTLPITCGRFKRILDIPGSTRDDDEDVSPPRETHPTPQPTPTPAPESDDERPHNWYDRVIDWWRRTWNTERGTHPEVFSDGSRIVSSPRPE